MKRDFYKNLPINEVKPKTHFRSLTNCKFETQLQKVLNCFKEHPKSMRMVEMQTNVMRPNICRYVKVLTERGLLKKVKYSNCPYTSRMVGFYTSNREHFRKHSSQLTLFS